MTAAVLSRESRAIGLIGFAHFLSHFYMLCLPPLFLHVRDDLGVTFVELGVVLTVYNAATAVLQTPMGVLVDRVGARRVLIGGLFLNAAAIALVGFTTSYWQLLALFLLAGAGNSVFHPADYVILTASVDGGRQGKAYSIHAFGGTIGFAAAPATMAALAAWFDWRDALTIAGLAGILLSFAFVFSGETLKEDAKTKSRERTPWRSVANREVFLFFLFFAFTTASSIGVTAFAAVFLPALYGVSVEASNFALSILLLGTAVGTLLGGPLADRTKRHDLVLLVAFLAYSVLVFAVGTAAIPAILLAAVFAASGLFRGLVNPARDIMVREAAPPGALGTAFAVVSTGFSIGQGLSPLLYGVLLDGGRFSAVLYLSGAFTLLAAGLVLFSRDRRM